MGLWYPGKRPGGPRFGRPTLQGVKPPPGKTYTTRSSRCECVCPPLFGATCNLPQFFDFSGQIPCICPEANTVAGKAQLKCDAWCNDGSAPGGAFTDITLQPDLGGGGCTDGWGYYCIRCVDGKLIEPAPPDHLYPGCGYYCCCKWVCGFKAPGGPDHGPHGDGCVQCIDALGTVLHEPCASAVSLYIGTYASSARCKNGPNILWNPPGGGIAAPGKNGCGNWMASVILSSQFVSDYCSGPCYSAINASGVNTVEIVFALDCGDPDATTGQTNIIGCNPNEITPCGPGTVVLPNGRCRKKVALHLNLFGWRTAASYPAIFTGFGADCLTKAIRESCFIDFSEAA